MAINDGNPDEAERLAKLALEELPPGWFYSRIVATSVLGEVLHCKGELTRSLALMQQTEQMARQHDVWHYALWSLIQQSEILFAQGFLQTAWETQEKAFQLINEQHLEQLPMHEFLVRIRAQLLWAGHGWMKPKRRRVAGLKSCRLISHSNSFSAGNVDSMLAGPW